MLNNNVVRALWNGMRHAPGHEHEPGWNGKRLLQSGVLLLPCRPVSSAARRGRAVASSSQSPAALSRSHASGPDRHVSARSVERRILCFSCLHMRSAGLLGKGLAEVQGAEALVEHAGAAGTARATPSRRAPSRIPQ